MHSGPHATIQLVNSLQHARYRASCSFFSYWLNPLDDLNCRETGLNIPAVKVTAPTFILIGDGESILSGSRLHIMPAFVI